MIRTNRAKQQTTSNGSTRTDPLATSPTRQHHTTSFITLHNTENNRRQFSSFLLFLSVIILVNLCPFQHHQESPIEQQQQQTPASLIKSNNNGQDSFLDWPSVSIKTMPSNAMTHLRTCLEFFQLMFRNPMRLGKRTTRFTLAEARMLGKMAKVWYIKKKIKKLGKKLKKHTIAVPVFTAIPIYEHSYYPQPHVTHVSHGPVHHAAAASSYSPTVAQFTSGPTIATGMIATTTATSQQQQQLATSASNQHPAYHRVPGHPGGQQHHGPAMFHHGHHGHPMHAANQIINAYAPSPPLYVDEAGGLYGHYGNAYGRYDGGYQLW